MSARIERFRRDSPASPSLELSSVVEALRHSREVAHNIRPHGRVREAPSPAIVAQVLDGLAMALFPAHLGPAGLSLDRIDLYVSNTLSTALARLTDQVARGLQFDGDGLSPAEARRGAAEAVARLARELPAIRAAVVSDLHAALRRDPSVESLAAVLICHRSTTAILFHRIAHVLHQAGARLVARVIADLAHSATAIEIHPAARIGPSFFISRGTGVVIGETTVIGANVCLHQGVTLGENDMAGAPPPDRGTPRHPVVEDNVVIHCNATVLGRLIIGAGSVICGNVWLTHSVPPGSVVTPAALQKSGMQFIG